MFKIRLDAGSKEADNSSFYLGSSWWLVNQLYIENANLNSLGSEGMLAVVVWDSGIAILPRKKD